MDVKIYSACKRKDRNIWQAKVIIGNKQTMVYGKTKNECISRALDKKNEYRHQIICDGTTLGEFASIWLSERCANLSPTSVQEWTRLVKKWIIPRLGHMRLTELRCSHCQSLISEYNKNHSSKSCKALRGVLHNMLEYARMNELILSNPCEHILIVQTPSYEYYIYSQEEMKALLDAVSGQPDFEIPITLASKCGLRAGEIFGLRWEDIDFEKRTLQVRQVSIYANGERRLKNVPKTATSTKPIVIPASVIEMLEKYKKTANFPLVICYDDGSPIVSNNFHKRFDNLLRLNGLPRTRFHDLRHFVATSLMDAGLPDKVISEYLRHSDTNITKRYQHIRASRQTVASDTMDALLG